MTEPGKETGIDCKLAGGGSDWGDVNTLINSLLRLDKLIVVGFYNKMGDSCKL